MGRKAVTKTRIHNYKKVEKLIELLTIAFKKHGTRKYTMETIAAELNISKSTLYQYFSSKDEMVSKVLFNFLQGVSEFENNLNNTMLPFEDRYFKNLALFSKSFSGMSNIFIADIKIDYPLIWNNIEKFNEYVSTVVKKFYEDGINAGVFSNFDSAIMAETDKLFFNMISNIEFLEKNNLTVNDVFENFFKMRLHGILNKNYSNLSAVHSSFAFENS